MWCASAKYIAKCNKGKLPQEKELINGLPGCGRKVTALILQDVWGKSELLTGDTHVCLGALAWGWADPTGKTMDADQITRQIEFWFPKKRYRELNSTFAGLRQLYFYVGNKQLRETARTTIKRIAKEMNCWGEIKLLVAAKQSQFFVVEPKSRN